MAVADLNLSRRDLLGAACAVPVLSVVEGPVAAAAPAAARSRPADEKRLARWSAALARFRGAEAALAVADGADEDRFGRLAERCDAAMCRLLRTPAPHAGALALKLELTVRHLVWELTGGDACLAALLGDAHRLARPA